ncbi:Hypothetical protein ABZS17I87_01033 [Kosakonia cowanii]
MADWADLALSGCGEMPDGAALIRPTVSGWHVNAVENA